MGLAACLLLSLMMQHLLKVQKDGAQPGIAAAVENALGARLTKPVTGKMLVEGGKPVLRLELVVFAGLKREDMAHSAANLVWRSLAGKPGAPALLRVVVDDELGGRPFELESPPPKSMAATPSTPSTPPGPPPGK